MGAIEQKRDLSSIAQNQAVEPPKSKPKKPKPPTESKSGGIPLDEFGDHKVAEIVRSKFDRVTGQPIEDFICVNHRLHKWEETHYEFVEDGIVKRQILEFIRQLYQWKKKDGDFIESFPYGSDRYAKGCLESVKASRFLPLTAIPRTGLNLICL